LSAGCFVLLKDRGKVAVAVLAGAFLLVNVYAVAKLPSEFDRRKAVAELYVEPNTTLEANVIGANAI